MWTTVKSRRDCACQPLGEFRRQLTNKAQWDRKWLAVIERWFPSSKLCGECAGINANLRPSWTRSGRAGAERFTTATSTPPGTLSGKSVRKSSSRGTR
ncbi:zinc ribbon domain-containing protein [Deinococcus hopiensis]|uniref:zinc ribbon domain-containing protein n=1 Tax=Deinococcus hopiensis TaxID=309885 RepID=UPI0026B6F49E